MKAIRVHTPGGPEALTYEDVPEPTPGAGQAAVRLGACGVNYIDVYFRTGQYKASLPLTVGLEGAGTVTAVGPGVADVKVGERVAWTGVAGSYAQMNVAPADRLVKLPDGLSFKDGAAAMLQGMTAHYLAASTYPLEKLFSKKFATSGSPAVSFLRKWRWPSNVDQNYVANLIAGQHMDPAKAAETWIKAHPAFVKTWLGK